MKARKGGVSYLKENQRKIERERDRKEKELRLRQ